MPRPAALAAHTTGSVAVEFALALPVMILLWLGSVEVAHVVRADMQLYNAAETAANIVANELSSVNGDITSTDNICYGAKFAMYPFPTAGNLTLAVASVTNKSTRTQSSANYYTSTFTTNAQWTVDWTNGATVNASGSCVAAPSTKVTTPAALSSGTTPAATYQAMVPNPRDSVVVVQASYTYKFNIGYGLPSSFSLSQTAYSRPRSGGSAPK